LQNVIGRAALLCRGPLITAADIEFDERPSSDSEVASSFRRAINAALQSGQTNLVSRLHDILDQELLLLGLTKCAGNQQKAERILGVPLSSLLRQDPGRPEAIDKNEKPKQRSPLRFQTEALLLIHNNPEWTVEGYAEKLGCSKATLYRYEAIKRALQARSGGR
jgi:transcriptional regulator of acetoin/glycerol metabolism